MKRSVALDVNGKTISVTIQRHHWSRKMKLSVNSGNKVCLTIPPRTPWRAAEAFLNSSVGWITKQLVSRPLVQTRSPSNADRKQARKLVGYKLAQWQPVIGVQAAKIRIGNQTSRWGSCSSARTLSFNWRLIELSEELVDYIVVHELAHLLVPNHSSDFWQIVESALPRHKELRRQLRELGPIS